jgi:outer membrane lipoprotein-sorting protein
MKKPFVIAGLLLWLLPAASLALTAREIVARSDSLIRGRSSVGTMSMTVKTPNWERTLKFQGWSRGRDKMLIVVTYPPKEAGSASLKVGGDMWNYLPKINRTIKIPPSMMLQSWMGSDFTNDDIVKESSLVDDYDHTLLGTATVEGNVCYKVQSVPKPKAAVIWGKIVYYCRTADFVPLREEFYSDKGEMIKLLTLSGIKYMHDRNYPTDWKMRTLNQPGRYTEMKFSDIKFNLSVPDSVFSLKNLGR